MEGRNKPGVLIPAYEPGEQLFILAGELLEKGRELVVVNDGSTGKAIFLRLSKQPGVTVLEHMENQGKGAALKTGLRYMRERGFTHAITADADGQHSATDILRMKEAVEKNGGSLVLGVRSTAEMPGRSRFGNKLTCLLLHGLYGLKLSDTQTGLRGIPLTGEKVEALLSLPGMGYEFETEMLIRSGELFPAGIVELPIQTIYLGQNESSHFRPIRDGMRIYRVLFGSLPRFLLSSLGAFVLDYLLFNLIYYMVFPQEVAAAVIARLISASTNYLINRNFVFRGRKESYTALNYGKLACGLLLANVLLLRFFTGILGVPAYLTKLFVEVFLYIVSFLVQSSLAHRHIGKKEK